MRNHDDWVENVKGHLVYKHIIGSAADMVTKCLHDASWSPLGRVFLAWQHCVTSCKEALVREPRHCLMVSLEAWEQACHANTEAETMKDVPKCRYLPQKPGMPQRSNMQRRTDSRNSWRITPRMCVVFVKKKMSRWQDMGESYWMQPGTARWQSRHPSLWTSKRRVWEVGGRGGSLWI